MQGQRSSVESFPGAFEFDHATSSRNSGMDQQICWNNMLLDPVETQNIPDYMIPPSDANTSYVNMANQDGPRLSIWHSGGPSSSEHSISQGTLEETKVEHGWTSPATINAVGGPRIEERHLQAANMLSLQDVNINLNRNQDDDIQSFSQNTNLNLPQNLGYNGHTGINSEVPESRLFPHLYAPELAESEHVSSSNGSSDPCGSCSGAVGFMLEDGDGRSGSSLDGRRSACKRKNIEGFPGQSSTSGSASFLHPGENSLLHSASSTYIPNNNLNISSSSDYLPSTNTSEGNANPGFGTVVRGVASDCYFSASAAGNAESSRRNFRMRINPGYQHDVSPPNLWSSGNTVRPSNIWSPNQPSSHLIQFNQPPEPRQVVASSSSQSQTYPPVVPPLPQNVYHFPWNGASNSRIGSSSSSVNSEERIINNISDFPPMTDVRHLVQDPSNWSLANRGLNIPGTAVPTSRAGTSSGVHPPPGPTWITQQNPSSARYSRNLSEVVRRSLLASSSSESGAQNNNFLSPRSGHSIVSRDMGHQPGASFRGHQHLHMRSAFVLDRQNDGVVGVPLTMRSIAAAREGRSRMISEPQNTKNKELFIKESEELVAEAGAADCKVSVAVDESIRNVIESMRRGENLRFEDVFILDQSVFYGAADLHDRHRDMRLDVDNMTYEELLALEERIGNVSTGLSEETVSKCLKQWKYSLATVEALMEDEPCCICQEQYAEGEDLGTLDCGHEFHTACIKEWLMRKNLCPICKNTALVT